GFASAVFAGAAADAEERLSPHPQISKNAVHATAINISEIIPVFRILTIRTTPTILNRSTSPAAGTTRILPAAIQSKLFRALPFRSAAVHRRSVVARARKIHAIRPRVRPLSLRPRLPRETSWSRSCSALPRLNHPRGPDSRPHHQSKHP